MGFDMYWNDPATDAEIAGSPDGRPEYFRLTVFGMAKAVGLMSMLSMADSTVLEKRLPTAADFDLDYVPQRFDEKGNRIDYAPDSTEERFLSAVERERDGDSGCRIPFYKLRTNDGWLVTPAEIERSLARYEECFAHFAKLPSDLPWVVIEDGVWTGELETVEWWGEWIEYLRAAAGHGGFRVL
jgi:hypothetical protein